LPSISMWPAAVRRKCGATESNSVCWHVALLFISSVPVMLQPSKPTGHVVNNVTYALG
jgi:hypothetical protein